MGRQAGRNGIVIIIRALILRAGGFVTHEVRIQVSKVTVGFGFTSRDGEAQRLNCCRASRRADRRRVCTCRG